MKKIEKIVDKHKSYLESINDGIIEGTLEGIKEGVVHGVKNGVKDGLRECFVRGIINIGQDDIRDILEEIPEEIIKNTVKESARYIFKKSTAEYLKRIFRKIVDRMRKEDIKLSKNQRGQILDIIIKSERKAVKKVVEKLPNNPFLKEITAGMQIALEESLKDSFKGYQKKLQKNKQNFEDTIEEDEKTDDLKADVKKSVKTIVKETVGDIIYKLIKMSTKRIVKELKEELKDKYVYKLLKSEKEFFERSLEKKLNEIVEQVAKQIVQDSTDRVNFIREIERSFEKYFKKYLLHQPSMPVWGKAVLITSVCLVLIGAVVYWLYRPIIPERYQEPTPPHVTEPTPEPGPEPKPEPKPEAFPDLVITEVHHQCSETGTTFLYIIENQGDGEAGSSITHLSIGDERIEDDVEPLSPGQSREEAFPRYPTPFGEIIADIEADGDNRINESNEENNFFEYRQIGCPPPPKPDLIITEVHHQWSETGTIFYYIIKNQGEGKAGSSITYLYIGGERIEDDVEPLSPGQSREEAFPRHPTPFSDIMADIEADGDNRIDESNEENNIFEYRQIG
ncbi:MAG: CARDB domain-containing protein [Promethearchaeota archaeon]